MSGTDRLTDDKLKRMADGLFNAIEMQLSDDLGSMARELLAHRRAEAAAWNDAIEAAGNLESIHGYSNAVPRHRIRALRRAAPTEGEALTTQKEEK